MITRLNTVQKLRFGAFLANPSHELVGSILRHLQDKSQFFSTFMFVARLTI
jgi:hypothetical protein